MKIYTIANWHERYENNRTRELKKIEWVPVPNKHDGDGYAMIMEQSDGPSLLGAWLAILQVASKCEPRGTLLRDTKIPHDSASIARQSRFPKTVIERALTFFSSRDMQWLNYTEESKDTTIPQDGAEIPQGVAQHMGGGSQEGALNGREWKGMELNTPTAAAEKKAKAEKPPKPPRPRDPIIDELALFECETLTGVPPMAWSRFAKAKKEIVAASPNVTADEIRRKGAAYKATYPEIKPTAMGLAGNWGSLNGSREAVRLGVNVTKPDLFGGAEP